MVMKDAEELEEEGMGGRKKKKPQFRQHVQV